MAASSFQLAGHNQSLQSLRGIAALIVAVGHVFLTMPHGRVGSADYQLSPAGAVLTVVQHVFQQNTAVIFFYVLSGFVLGETLRQRNGIPFGRRFAGFVIRRGFRLLPVMWVAVALAVLVRWWIGNPDISGITSHARDIFSRPLTLDGVLLHAMALSTRLNGPLWSVQVELVMAVYLPLLVILADRGKLLLNVAVLIFGAWLSLFPLPWPIRVAYCFHVGLLLPHVMAWPPARKLMASGWFTLTALASLIPVDIYYNFTMQLAHKYWFDTAISAQIVAFVLLRPEHRFVDMLNLRPLTNLGDVSYSFYAYATPVQLLVVSSMFAWMGNAAPASDAGALAFCVAASLMVITFTFVLAVFSHRWIELWSIRSGRHWGAHVERSLTMQVSTRS